MKTRTIAMAVLALAALTGCGEDGVTPTAEQAASACSHIQTPLSQAIGRRTLHAGDGPYSLEGRVEFTHLEIEAGTVICGFAEATLFVTDSLTVSGTAEQPVVFTAVDSTAPWGGVIGQWGHGCCFPTAQVTMSHAVVEHAERGVNGRLALESVRFRRISGIGVEGYGTVTDVVVDEACYDFDSSLSSCAGIRGRGNTILSIEGAIIRDSGAHGLLVWPSTRAEISGLVIENPAGSGIVVRDQSGRSPAGDLYVTGPVSVHGQGEFLIEGPMDPVLRFMDAYADSVHPGHRVKSRGGTTQPVIVPPGVTWLVDQALCCSSYTIGSVSIGAGAEFSVGDVFLYVDTLKAYGTSDDPARITGSNSFRISGTLILEHTRIELESQRYRGSTIMRAQGNGEHRMTDISIEGGGVVLDAPRTRVERAIVEHATLAISGLGSVVEDIVVISSPTHGIEVAADSVQIRQCDVTLSSEDGIHVTEGSGVVVSECDLSKNGGDGVANEETDTVTARGNWWGDPSGPLGAEGDGVQGAVDHSQPRSVSRASAPVSVVVRPATSTVPTGDSVRFFVEVRDKEGLRVSPTLFALRPLNAALVFPDPDDPFLAVGRSVGTGRVEVVSLADSTLRSSTEISVVEGAPFLRWEWADTTWSEGAVAVLPFTSTRFVVASQSGEVRFVDGNTVTTTQFVEGGSIQMDGPSFADVWAVSSHSNHSHLTHWDGTSWARFDSIPGRSFDIWGLSPSRASVLWSGGIRELRDGTWADAWITTTIRYCRNLAVVSPTEAYAWCPPNVLRYDESSWEPLPTAAPTGVGGLIVYADGTIRIVGSGTRWVLEGDAWQSFSVPDGLLAVENYVRYGLGTFVGTEDGLWYLGPTDRWQRVWVGPPKRGQPWSRFGVQDLREADGVVFMMVSGNSRRWLLRGTPWQ